MIKRRSRSTAKGADEAFGDGVGPRRSYRRLDDPDVGRGEYGVEGRDELGVTVADQEPEATAGVIQIQRLRACWVSHAPVGRVVTPRMCTRRVACSMTKNALSRCRVIVSICNRSQAKIECACARRNSARHGGVRGRSRHYAGSSRRWRRRSGSRVRRAHRGRADTPRSDSRWPSAKPACALQPGWRDDPAEQVGWSSDGRGVAGASAGWWRA